jgi:Tfp pilus assembly protein PilF
MLYEASVFKEGEKDGVCTTYYEETGATDCIDTYKAGRVIIRVKFDQTGMFLYEKSEPIPEIEEEREKEAELHLDKGIELLGIGCFKQAVREVQQAIAANHDFIEAYIKLALAYRHLGRYCDYRDTLKRVLEIRPDHSEACFSMAIAHIVTGNRTEAMVEQHILQGLDERYAKELMSILTL